MVMRQSDVSTAKETVTVYQQVYVDGANTKTHVTVTGAGGGVIARRFSSYEAYPLAQIAAEHRSFMLRALRRSLEIEAIIYDCNVMGRVKYTPKADGWKTTAISHPRFGKGQISRVDWQEPEPEEEEMTDEQAA